jgi:protein arginine N-methyltransferase 7
MWIDGTNNLQDLWKSRSCLSKIEGFDHSGVNTTLGACGHLPELEEGPCLPLSHSQCGEFDVINLLKISHFRNKLVPSFNK